MATHYNKGNIMTMVETTRQRLGFKKGDMFEPTPNVRNPHMLEEAQAFSPQLKSFERAVRDYHRHVQGFLGSLLPLLDENLPRVWTAVSGGLAEPVRSQISHGHPSRIGGDYSAPLILERLELLNRGMEEDILAPLRRWQEGLAIAKERMNSLEWLRKDVDKERRKAEKKFKRQENKLRRAYLGAGYDSSSSSSSDYEDNDYVVPRGRLLEDYQRLALHTERHLNALMESYRDQERLLWEQLSGLVTDAAWLESYAAAAMLKVKETMQAVALALGPCKQPLPAFRHAAYPFDGQYGQIRHNIELIKGFGPRARELASGAKPHGADYLPYTPLRAKRGVSTPLMVGAAAGTGHQQQRLAMKPVPPVQLGASSIPMESVPSNVRESAIRRVEERAMGSGTRVADMPALPPALTPGSAGGSAGRMSPLTPSSHMAPTAATGTMRGSSTAATGMRGSSTAAISGGYGGSSSSALAPATAGRASNMRIIPESPRTTTSTSTTTASGSSSKGIVQKATEAASAAAGSVAGAAMAPAAMAAGAVRGAAESFQEGVAAGNRDTTERVRERGSVTAAGVGSAPGAGRLSSGTTTSTAPTSSVSTGAAGGRGGADMMGNGASGTAAGIPRSSGQAGAGPLSSEADASPRAGSGSGSGSMGAVGLLTGTQIKAGTAGSEVSGGPIAAAGGVTDNSSMSESPREGMGERGAGGVSDVTGEQTPGGPSATAPAPTAAAATVYDDGMDSFVSALKGPLATGTTSVTGLKQQHHTMAAAPAGYDDPASTYSSSHQRSAGCGGEGRMVGEQQQQQGGLMGAVKRAVGA